MSEPRSETVPCTWRAPGVQCKHAACRSYARHGATANLVALEDAVERACQAIYAQREGYRPSDMERHHIAIALVAYSDSSGGSDA